MFIMANEGAQHCSCLWAGGGRLPDPSCPTHKGS